MSELSVLAEHAAQLLDIYASNPSYNSRVVFLLADDLIELILKSYLRGWRQRNPGILSDPSNFPQAAYFTITTFADKASLTSSSVLTAWEALEPNAPARWRGGHLDAVQISAEYRAIKQRRPALLESLEDALQAHAQRNKLYHDPTFMRMAPAESTVTGMVANVLALGNHLFTRRFESLIRQGPLGKALFAWFHLHMHRYQDDGARRSLENCFQSQPTCGKDKLDRFNQEDVGWLFVRDPDFGHSWLLLHIESATYGKILEDEAVSHKLITRLRR